MSDSTLFTSESVTEGHPDKLADQISDAVLDAVLAQDPDGRVACEALVTTGLVLVAGEISTSGYVDVTARAREVLRDAGYLHAEYGIGYKTCGVLAAIQEQSPDIAIGVDQGGAGDQGMMFGYATNETPELMPLPIQLAHHLARRLAEVRRTEPALSYLRPDGKSQVTVEYRDGRPTRLASVLISAQTAPGVTHTRLLDDIREHVIAPVVPPEMVDGRTEYLVNPTGIFVVGGPQGDTGLTGRKIIVDTYGGMARHGGGCFSGKDPTKVDRSAAYMMRYVARQVVGAGLAERCEIEIAYAIGQQHPLSISVDTFGTGRLPGPEIARLIERHFDLTPAGIIEKLNLRRPIYRPLACYGHFGRTDLGVPWEQDDMVDTLRAA